MEPFATVEDLEKHWHPLTDEQEVVAEQLLESASALIRNEFPDIDSRIAAGKLSSRVPLVITVEMVKRVMRNPEGALQKTTGPFSVTYHADALAAELFLTDEDRRQLRPRRKMMARTIRTRPGLW